MHSRWQDNLEFWQYPEARNVFYWFSKAYEIAKGILILLISFIFKFPKTALGILVGATIGFFISIIPLIGWILAPVVKPVCIITGGIVGFLKDKGN